jgi:hypothetical protein
VPVAFDWSRREVVIGEPVSTTADLAADVAALMVRYQPRMARYPECFWDQTALAELPASPLDAHAKGSYT